MYMYKLKRKSLTPKIQNKNFLEKKNKTKHLMLTRLKLTMYLKKKKISSLTRLI